MSSASAHSKRPPLGATARLELRRAEDAARGVLTAARAPRIAGFGGYGLVLRGVLAMPRDALGFFGWLAFHRAGASFDNPNGWVVVVDARWAAIAGLPKARACGAGPSRCTTRS
jgi:hypothetical protein